MPRSAKIFLATLSLIGWFALIAQFYLIIENRVAPVPETIIRYFSFFTILTNLIVSLCCILLLLKPFSVTGKFFSRSATLTAVAMYITTVGLVYNIVLRFTWNPHGLQLLVDELLHTIIPLLFIVFWFRFVSKTRVAWKNILVWLIYPSVYMIYILTRGSASGFYPYPFVNVNELGYKKVFIHCIGLLILFLMLSLLFVGVTRLRSKRIVNSPGA